MPSGLLRSYGRTATSGAPFSRHFAATGSSSSAVGAVITSRAPPSAQRYAQASPMPEEAPVIQTVSIYLYREMSGMGLSYSPRSSRSLISLKAARVRSTSSIEWAAVGMMRKMTMPSGMTG